MRCIFGHWVIGIWNTVYRVKGGGYICGRHAEMLERVGAGQRRPL